MENFDRLVEKVIESHRIQRGQKSAHPVKDYRSNVFFFLKESHFFIQKFLPGSSNVLLTFLDLKYFTLCFSSPIRKRGETSSWWNKLRLGS